MSSFRWLGHASSGSFQRKALSRASSLFATEQIPMATKAGNLQVSVVEGKGLKGPAGAASADPYVRLTLGTQEVRCFAARKARV